MILAPDALAETALLAVSAMQRQALTRKISLMYAFAPDGTPITGTLERLAGEASVAGGSFSRGPEGSLTFDHAGGTAVWWDGQTTVTRGGMTVFIDDNGAEWTEDQLVLSDDENWSPEEVEEPASDKG